MRALALLGLLIGCDDDKAEGAGSPPQETTETVADSGSTDTGSTDTADTDTADTGSTDTADTGSTDTDPCEGKTVGIDVGDCALNFALVDADGTTHELHSYAGQVLLLDFSGFT